MTNVLERLVEYPNAPVFDKSAKETLAFRLRHSDGLVWSVADGVLTTAVGASVSHFALEGRTISSLIAELQNHGFEVPYFNPDMLGRAAHTLLRGSKSQDETNGDHMVAFSSLLWCIYAAFGAELDEAEYQIEQALRQMVITQAEGDWLDVWANLYGIPRTGDETDSALQARIPDEAFALRVNGLAIEERIRKATGKTVEIFEPWTLMFTLDQSVLSGPDHVRDDVYYNYHVIQPRSRTPVDFSDVLPVVERNRAAGVVVYDPQVLMPVSHVFMPAAELDGSAATGMHATRTFYEDRVLLDWMEISDVPVLNHPSIHGRDIRRFSQVVPYPGSPGDDVVVGGKHSRDYRNYVSLTEYTRTWTGSWSVSPWTETVVVQGKHTSSS